MVRKKSSGRRFINSGRGRDEVFGTHILVHRNIFKPFRFKVLQDIKRLRRSTNLLIPKLPFARLVREIMVDLFPDGDINRIQAIALEALQEATESYLVQFFEDCTLLTLHAKRATLYIQDMLLLRRLRGRNDIINR